MRCKSCGQPAYMGKARKPRLNPTEKKKSYHYCPMCGWSDKPKTKKIRKMSPYEIAKERRKEKKEKKIEAETPVQEETEVINDG